MMLSNYVFKLFAAAAVAVIVTSMAPMAEGSPGRVAKVGWLQWQTSGPYAELTHAGFELGLRDEGFVEGKNLVFERRSAEGDIKRFPRLARELAVQKVEVFFAPSKAMADAAWYASRSTPTVIATIGDPVELKFVKSLARPGTQVTGVTTATPIA